jgi:undecaprenyl-diphosphatase
MVVVLVSAWMLTRWVIRSWNGRVPVRAAAALHAGVIGFSPVLLGVHYLSDVAAGWPLGAVWAGTVALACGWREAARGTARTPRVRQAAAGAGPGGLACRPMPERALDGHPAGASGWLADGWSRPGPGRR